MDDQHCFLEDWGKPMGDIPSATAILDYILHRTEFIQRGGKSCCLGIREKVSKWAKTPIGSVADKQS